MPDGPIINGWVPGGCPRTREQGFGHQHFHSARCGASPEQIARDSDYLAGLAEKPWWHRAWVHLRGWR